MKSKEHVHRGPLPVIGGKGLLFIKRLVDNKPDILIAEICELYAKKFKVIILQAMVSNAFRKLNLVAKRKVNMHLNRNGKMTFGFIIFKWHNFGSLLLFCKKPIIIYSILVYFLSYETMPRDLIQERTQAGLKAARARGRMGGRPPMLDNRQINR